MNSFHHFCLALLSDVFDLQQSHQLQTTKQLSESQGQNHQLQTKPFSEDQGQTYQLKDSNTLYKQ